MNRPSFVIFVAVSLPPKGQCFNINWLVLNGSNKSSFYHYLFISDRQAHSDEAPHVCKQCSKAFKWKKNLDIHLKAHLVSRKITIRNRIRCSGRQYNRF